MAKMAVSKAQLAMHDFLVSSINSSYVILTSRLGHNSMKRLNVANVARNVEILMR